MLYVIVSLHEPELVSLGSSCASFGCSSFVPCLPFRKRLSSTSKLPDSLSLRRDTGRKALEPSRTRADIVIRACSLEHTRLPTLINLRSTRKL